MITEVKEHFATALEAYFDQYRRHIIGQDQTFYSPYGEKKIIYTDWTASGRLYRPIEDKLCNEFGPFVANTHTETTVSGTAMTNAYRKAKQIIKQHVNANGEDVLIACGNGMTGVINKFQRILGLKIPENLREYTHIPDEIRPVVFISHMEHHSNQTSWLETMAKVVVVPPNKDGLFCLKNLESLLIKHKDRALKVCSVVGGSNVTGIETPYHDIAKLMHKYAGVCFVDFACSAPYVEINMHPEDKDAQLDAIFFSPHKFLGGPGSSGVLVFNKQLYNNMVPDCPGGGTVSWTNPWGEHKYIDNIEDREDGGTPGFLQTIKTALSIKLKEQMGVENILKREHELVAIVFKKLESISNIKILASQHRKRLGVISFYIDDLHYNLGVKLLNDRFGIQTRGGCSCAGTYGHFLLHVDQQMSRELTDEISLGELVRKPGWIRMSIHPTTTNEEVEFVCDSILALAQNHKDWAKDYDYSRFNNEFVHKSLLHKPCDTSSIDDWFDLD
ncbi:MAG: aminotransferase class V-fold PLP-dependent enzyme [Winogradskyella sp.]|uniref:aminotransferase class V-fold PLP-dependent enzyme n=1 Tax=Winogradskyella sp. TaxID=1883156 RepID=UPI0025F510C6|nr:aminotransferase class V-fold PLP-dependent enzyme [Winogradskyella sp.]NRB83489.1 aminotransferase class V-fold PLP-dependent enzyme [Winogradskyella sp.]